MMVLLLLEFLVSIALPVPALGDNQRSTVAAWIDSLPFDRRVTEGIELFARERQSKLDEGYASRLAAGIRGLIAADAERRLEQLSGGVRRPFVEVSILKPGFASAEGRAPDNATERDFEASFVRIEVVAFFEHETETPAAALDIYTNEEFRKSVSPRIRRIWNEDNELCYEVGGVKLLVRPVEYCDRIEELEQEDISLQHAQAVRNKGEKGDQTVYFKESLKTFMRLPDGLAFHYVNYSRTADVSGIRGKLARIQIEDSEKKALEELGRRLASRRSKAAQ
jgi:hypothetical protein